MIEREIRLVSPMTLDDVIEFVNDARSKGVPYDAPIESSYTQYFDERGLVITLKLASK